MGGPEGKILDHSEVLADLHHVPNGEMVFHHDEDTVEEVPDYVLGCQGDGQPGNAEPRQYRHDVDIYCTEERQESYRPEAPPQEVDDQAFERPEPLDPRRALVVVELDCRTVADP